MGENSESNTRTNIKVIGIIIVFLFIVHLCNEDENTESYSPPPKKESVAPLNVSIDKLIANYDANEVAADALYKGKIIRVEGVITDFGTELLGHKYVTIEDPNIPFYYVQCVFKREYSNRFARYSKGDVISVTEGCRGKGVLSDYNILMDECK